MSSKITISFLIISMIVFTSNSLPAPAPIFDFDWLDLFFESDEDLQFENQNVTIECKNCSVSVNGQIVGDMATTMAPAAPAAPADGMMMPGMMMPPMPPMKVNANSSNNSTS